MQMQYVKMQVTIVKYLRMPENNKIKHRGNSYFQMKRKIKINCQLYLNRGVHVCLCMQRAVRVKYNTQLI